MGFGTAGKPHRPKKPASARGGPDDPEMIWIAIKADWSQLQESLEVDPEETQKACKDHFNKMHNDAGNALFEEDCDSFEGVLANLDTDKKRELFDELFAQNVLSRENLDKDE